MALRVPISRVRSVTETSMMFTTPIPPTSSDTAAMAGTPDRAASSGITTCAPTSNAAASRQSAIGNRQSAIGNRQSAIGNRQSAGRTGVCWDKAIRADARRAIFT
jgi:hypothetical protein